MISYDKKYNILTSNGVQKRYLEAIKRRKNQHFIKNYCLFDINDYINSHNDNINIIIEDIKTQSKVKESKVKETRVKHYLQEYVFTLENVSKLKKQLTENECIELVNKYDEDLINKVLLSMENYSKIKNYTSVYLTCKNWCDKEIERNPDC